MFIISTILSEYSVRLQKSFSRSIWKTECQFRIQKCLVIYQEIFHLRLKKFLAILLTCTVITLLCNGEFVMFQDRANSSHLFSNRQRAHNWNMSQTISASYNAIYSTNQAPHDYCRKHGYIFVNLHAGLGNQLYPFFLLTPLPRRWLNEKISHPNLMKI